MNAICHFNLKITTTTKTQTFQQTKHWQNPTHITVKTKQITIKKTTDKLKQKDAY